MNPTIEQLLHDVDGLVSLPQVSMRVNEMVDDPGYSASDIGKVISQDPGLTARLLRIANSPFYGLSNTVDTVARAVTVLGLKQIRDLVIATTSIQAFEGIPNDIVTMDDFWKHNISCGIAARYLAHMMPGIDKETMFIAGLLHDIGQLIIFSKLPQQALRAISMMEDDPQEPELHQVETRIMGFDHAQLGAALLKQWHLPAVFQQCTGFHHNIEGAQLHPRETALVHISNAIAVMAELNSTTDESPSINEKAWEITRLDTNVIGPAMEEVQTRIKDVLQILMG